jgi:hypothetical protein
MPYSEFCQAHITFLVNFPLKNNVFKRRFACLLSVLLSGCLSISSDGKNWDPYSFPATTEEHDIDYSYPVTEKIAETGTILYKRDAYTQFDFFPKLSGKEYPLTPPLNDTEIFVSGTVAGGGAANALFIHIPAKSAKGTPEIHWTPYDYEYTWRGEIAFDGAVQTAMISFNLYASDQEGKLLMVVLNSAISPFKNTGMFSGFRKWFTNKKPNDRESHGVNMEFNTYLSRVSVVEKEPPYQWGIFILDDRKYTIYAVIEDNYYAMYPDFTQMERGKNAWFGSRVTSRADFFLKKGQKFQIVNIDGVVVSELFGDVYRIYDTLPEHEWGDIKRNLAMLYVFRLITRSIYWHKGFDLSANIPYNFSF